MAVASSSDEIDLMPLDVSKEAEAESYQPFPEGPPPPSAKPAKSAPKLADPSELDVPDEVKRKPMPQAYEPPQQSNLMLYVGGGIAGLIILFGLWRMIRTENKIVFGKERFDTTWIVQANSAQVENFDITGTIKWTLDVTPTDDSVLVGVVKRNPKDPKTVAALKQLPDPYDAVKKAEPFSKTGEFHTGQYSVVVMNDGKKPVHAKVKFKAQP
jgi:hypothetical protein